MQVFRGKLYFYTFLYKEKMCVTGRSREADIRRSSNM